MDRERERDEWEELVEGRPWKYGRDRNEIDKSSYKIFSFFVYAMIIIVYL